MATATAERTKTKPAAARGKPAAPAAAARDAPGARQQPAGTLTRAEFLRPLLAKAGLEWDALDPKVRKALTDHVRAYAPRLE